MIRFLSFLIILLIGVLSLQVFAGEGKPVPHYSMYPQLKWEDERLIGELSNCPVKTLLEELSRKEGFQLEIIGDLNRKLDLSFDHLTLEQSIKKIMRLSNLSYVMILDVDGQSENKALYRLSKLIVCQKDKSAQSSSSRTQRTRPVPQKRRLEKKPPQNEKEEAISQSSEPSTEHRQRQKKAPKKAEMEFEGSPEDLRSYVEEMSREGLINSEEYKMILEKMEGEKNTD